MTSATIDIKQRNADILEVLRMATPMLKSMSFQFGIEHDELCNMAFLAAIENYEKAQGCDNPRAYLYGVMRNVLWYAPRDEVTTISLDAPCASDSDTLFSDLVPAPPLREVNLDRRMEKERALYAGIRKLPLEVQHYLMRVHELHAYRPVRPKKGRFTGKRPNWSKDPGTLSRQAYYYLRKDRRLAHIVCGTPITHELDFEQDHWETHEDEMASPTNLERDYWADESEI